MKLRHASIVWAASALVMLAGLGLASAQPQQPQNTPTPPIQARPGIIPPIEPGGIRPATAPLGQPIQPRVTPPGGGVVPPGTVGGTGNIQQFDTGVDYRPTGPGQRVTFNLEDADLPDLVRLVSTLTGKRFIIGGKTRSIKASVYAPTKVTAGEAYQAFLSILQMNGMTVVPAGRYLKIVETTGIENLPVPTYTGGEATSGDERYLTRMHRLENVAAEDVATLLSRFKSREGNVTAYAPTNTVIITDMGSNIRRMLRIVEAIDVPRSGEQIWIEQIHYANATELAQRIGEIFPVGVVGGGGGGGRATTRPAAPAAGATTPTSGEGQPTGAIGSRGGGEIRITKILPDERTNSLIIVATERAYLRILEIIRMLDVPLEGEGRIHVHYVQHGSAEDIAATLSTIVGGGGGGGGAAGGNRAAGAGAGGGESQGVFEGNVRVTAHKPTNALVVTSSLHDYAALRRVIDRLDMRRRQVFLEAVIMDLNVTRSSKLGLGFHGGVPDFPSDGSISIFGFNAQASALPFIANQEVLQSLALGIRGPAIPESQQLIGVSIPAFGAVITALANSGDGNVLSTPHIIAMDNEEAEISVGQNVPLQTSGVGLGGGGLGGLAGLAGLTGGAQAGGGLAGLSALGGLGGGFGTVPRQEVGTKIHVTPHLNESDEVRLDIDMEDSDVVPGSEGTLGVKSFSKRTAKTKLVVRDQQTVVIGGLMRDSVINTETKVPILGDIPLLGILFRQTTREHRKSNLLLFLTPYIVRSPADLRAIFERKMRERQEFIDRYFVFGDLEYEPPIDYSRTRGLLGEIFTELTAIDEEQRLLEAIRAGPTIEHVPRPPVGSAAADTPVSQGDVVISPDGDVTNDSGGGGDTNNSPPPPQNEQPQPVNP